MSKFCSNFIFYLSFFLLSSQFASAQCYSVTFMVDLGSNIPDPSGKIYVMGNFKSPSWVAGAVRLNKIDGTVNRYAITVVNICKDTFDFIFLNGDSSLASSREVFLNPTSQPCLVSNGPSNYDRRFIKTSVGNITLAYNFKSCPTILPLGLNTARKVLYEVFSSSTLPASTGQHLKGLADSINFRYKNSSTIIYYPVNWPGSGDPYFTSEVNTKRISYQINAVPTTFIDGKFIMHPMFIKYTDTTRIMHNIPSFVKMTTNHAMIGNQITVIDSINSNIQILGSNYKLRTAIVEVITKNNIKTSGDSEFFYVVKKMLPDQTIGLNSPNTNQVFNRSFSFPGNYRLPSGSSNAINLNTEHSVENFNNLIAVSWIQNDSSKEVIQSSWSDAAKVIISDSVICSYDDSIVVYAFGGRIMLGQQNLGSNLVRLKPTTATQYVFRSFDGLKNIPFTIYVDDSISITPNVTNVNFNTCGSNSPFIIGGTTTYGQSKTFSWYLNDTLLGGKTLSIDTFRLGGVYKLRVTSHRGCFAEQAFNVSSLNPVFSPNFSSNRQNATSAPFDFTFANQTPSLSAYSYTWHWGDGTKDTSSNPIVFKTYFANGTYTVKLVAADKNTGCKDSITKTNYIICSGLLPLNFTSFKTQPSCFGISNASITVNASGGAGSYLYRINNGVYQSNNIFNNLGAGAYTIQVKDANSTEVGKTDTIVNPAPVSIGGITGDALVGVGSLKPYQITAQNGAIYAWNIINGTLLAGNGTNSIQVQWGSTIGFGKINISITKNGCSATDSLVVTLSVNPITISTLKQNESCPGASNGSIVINATNGNPPYLYALNNGTYQISNTFNNLTGGIYFVQLKDNNQIVANKYDTILTGIKPTASAIVGPTIVGPLDIDNYIVGQQMGVSYTWDVLGGVIVNGQNTNVVQVAWGSVTTLGKVTVRIINSFGCSDSSQLVVNIGSVGVKEEMQLNEALIYPNPSFGGFTVEIPKNKIQKVEIINSLGELIGDYKLVQSKENQLEVYLNSGTGIYLINIYTNSGIIRQKILLIK